MCSLIDEHGGNVKTTVGIHPYEAKEDTDLNELTKAIKSNLTSKHISSIGECGLDYTSGFPDRTIQIPIFRRHVEIAVETKSKVFLHTRSAEDDTIRVLEECRGEDGKIGIRG